MSLPSSWLLPFHLAPPLLPGSSPSAWLLPFLQPLGHVHWCHHTVTRTVSCQVQNGSETVVQRVYQSCRWPGPCANLVSYRTLIRPTYRVSYRTVTALEWRCCPGFTGSNCEEGGMWQDRGMASQAVRCRADMRECMNCTRISDMSERLTTLEAKVSRPGAPGLGSWWVL
uniref:EMI domain-containing protein n=1 Tax=Ursus americanus TaxID=9643 RepID=A0A452SNN2_URSAM